MTKKRRVVRTPAEIIAAVRERRKNRKPIGHNGVESPRRHGKYAERKERYRTFSKYEEIPFHIHDDKRRRAITLDNFERLKEITPILGDEFEGKRFYMREAVAHLEQVAPDLIPTRVSVPARWLGSQYQMWAERVCFGWHVERLGPQGNVGYSMWRMWREGDPNPEPPIPPLEEVEKREL